AYARDSMETWERLALTRARSLKGWDEVSRAIAEHAFGKEWTAEENSAILQMRERVQTERLRAWESKRDLKLGPGFLLDIEWLISIVRLRNSDSTPPAP